MGSLNDDAARNCEKNLMNVLINRARMGHTTENPAQASRLPSFAILLLRSRFLLFARFEEIILYLLLAERSRGWRGATCFRRGSAAGGPGDDNALVVDKHKPCRSSGTTPSACRVGSCPAGTAIPARTSLPALPLILVPHSLLFYFSKLIHKYHSRGGTMSWTSLRG